jgi:hypothetical protein
VTSTSTYHSTYSPTLTGALANAHVEDLLRDARRSRAAALLPGPTRHRTPRRRPAWWLRGTVRAHPAA